MRFKQLKVHSKIDKKLPYSYPYSIRQYSLFFLISFFYEYIYVQFEMRFCNICIIHNRYSFLVFFTQFELLYSIYIFFAAIYPASILSFLSFSQFRNKWLYRHFIKKDMLCMWTMDVAWITYFFLCAFFCVNFFFHTWEYLFRMDVHVRMIIYRLKFGFETDREREDETVLELIMRFRQLVEILTYLWLLFFFFGNYDEKFCNRNKIKLNDENWRHAACWWLQEQQLQLFSGCALCDPSIMF